MNDLNKFIRLLYEKREHINYYFDNISLLSNLFDIGSRISISKYCVKSPFDVYDNILIRSDAFYIDMYYNEIEIYIPHNYNMLAKYKYNDIELNEDDYFRLSVVYSISTLTYNDCVFLNNISKKIPNKNE